MPRKSSMSYETEGDTFAKQLKETMKEHGESQTSLAAKITNMGLPIQRQTISLYMNGQSKPDTDRLTMLAKALNVSADWLLGLSPAKSTDSDIRSICEATGLSEDIVEYFVRRDKKVRTTVDFDKAKVFCGFFSAERLEMLLVSIYTYLAFKGDLYQFANKFINDMGKCPNVEQTEKLKLDLADKDQDIRYIRFEIIDLFTSLFDGVMNTEEVEHQIESLEKLLEDHLRRGG